MTNEDELIEKVVDFVEQSIFQPHIKASLEKHTKLRSYKINPIIVKYLSKVLEDEYTPIGVAKALYFPRVLGTSINTSFGTQVQNMFVELGIAQGSMIKGMDIEFIDRHDNRKKWCQLKAGPNTINSEDVKPILSKFEGTIRLAKTNNAMRGIRNSDFIVGVLYGTSNELSQHYRKINDVYPVYIGNEFWSRITGYENIYSKLEDEMQAMIESLNTHDFINQGCNTLAEEISRSSIFDFR
ncbi:Type II restriction endonuclease [Cyclonatronum proteinivorum]|uniref:Type II restriction endonuclease n=1 Tax=Cyclonatronum proteinivorum TaxID=1457365 RepID=A0A345UI25_9BACT|nr:PmeII family type II restriction endonuclease [Cyclonatronum proteinivorum]AXJ00127.1 Type II restriction endonuclease [Cyclonatronum proteinivorum]